MKSELLALAIFIAAVAYVRGQYGWVAAEVTRTDVPPVMAPAPVIGQDVCGPYNQRCTFTTRPIDLNLDARPR